MTTKNVIVSNISGLHARPAATFSQFCNTFPNTITVTYEGIDINPKSIIMLMSSGIRQDAEIMVCVEGDNHDEVCQQIVDFILNIKDE